MFFRSRELEESLKEVDFVLQDLHRQELSGELKTISGYMDEFSCYHMSYPKLNLQCIKNNFRNKKSYSFLC